MQTEKNEQDEPSGDVGAYVTHPVVGSDGAAVLSEALRIGPNVVVGVGVFLSNATEKPRMLVTCVVRHEVQDYSDACSK